MEMLRSDSVCVCAFVRLYHLQKCSCASHIHICFCVLCFMDSVSVGPRFVFVQAHVFLCVSLCVFVVCPSWTGSRSPQRLGPCVTCCGPTPWKTLATRRPRSTSGTTQLEAAPISTGTGQNQKVHSDP